MIPIIGENHQQRIEVQLDPAQQLLTIWVGTAGTRIPVDLGLARQLGQGLLDLAEMIQARSAPMTGDRSRATPAIDLFRE